MTWSGSRTSTAGREALLVVYLGLGSNVGDRRAHLAHALQRLDREWELTGISSVWETDPVGYRDQDRFLEAIKDAYINCC